MIGRVVSTRLKNTATVLVERVAKHPLYKKTFTRSKKYLVDDKLGVKDGDLVEITGIRPMSKRKHWKILKVLGRSLVEIAEAHLKEKGEKIISEVMPAEVDKEKMDQVKSKVKKTEEKEIEKPKAKRVKKEIK